MKRVCVVTATRAEYGLLRRVIQNIIADDGLELILVVTGSHLSETYGYTVREIEEDGFPIAERIEILEEHSTEAGICKAMGNAAIRFGEMYGRQRPDLVIVEGDRYELLPICSSAMIYGIPIAHISGGEITEGAIDDVVRHCITKMSYLHFPACEEYRERIMQLGEPPERVFNFGDVGVENVRKMEYMPKAELEKSMGMSLEKPYASVTFHPVTLEKSSAKKQTEELVNALKAFQDLNFIVTMANADLQGEEINKIFHDNAKGQGNIFCYTSLGIRRYLSLIRYAEFVIGNSSSGIVEVPCFGIPTINIGDRQKGRLRAESVIDCEPEADAIKRSIGRAMSPSFRRIAQEARNPYGDGDTALSIVNTIKSFLESGAIRQKKKFYDIDAFSFRVPGSGNIGRRREMKSFDITWEEIHATQEWGKYPSEPVIRFVARNYYKMDRKNVRILDFGCGGGSHTWYLAKEGFDVYAFDGSKSAVKKVSERLEQEGLSADLRVRDALELDYGEGFFDCVIDSATIYANKLQNILSMYQKVYGLLKQGGKLFSISFTTSTTGYGTGREVEKNTFCDITEGSLEGRGVAHFYEEGQLEKMLKGVGFRNVVVDTMRFTDRGNVVEQFLVQGEK